MRHPVVSLSVPRPEPSRLLQPTTPNRILGPSCPVPAAKSNASRAEDQRRQRATPADLKRKARAAPTLLGAPHRERPRQAPEASPREGKDGIARDHARRDAGQAAQQAIARFEADYGVKYPKTVASLRRDEAAMRRTARRRIPSACHRPERAGSDSSLCSCYRRSCGCGVVCAIEPSAGSSLRSFSWPEC